MDGLKQDPVFALRVLRKAPAVSAVAILSLGITIGATTSIFSVVSALLLKPLPFPSPSLLVAVEDVEPNTEAGASGNLSWPEFLDLRAHAPDLTGLAAYTSGSVNLSGRGEPQRVVARYVSDGFFDVLGAPPVAGRTFSKEEHRQHGPRAVMVAPGFWRRALGEMPVRGSLVLDGEPYTLVGVENPAAESIVSAADAWLPFESRYLSDNRGSHFFFAVGRLAPGVTLLRAQADLAVVAKQLAESARAEHLAAYTPLREKLRGGAVLEHAAFEQRDAHRREVARGHLPLLRVGLILLRHRRPADDAEVADRGVVTERQAAARADRAHLGQRLQPREAEMAGKSPMARPVRSDTVTAKASTRPSSGASCRLGMYATDDGHACSAASRPQSESRRPSAPPQRPSTALSVSSCRASRHDEAPSARRTANSRTRPLARASSTLARLTAAMSSTVPTAASSSMRMGVPASGPALLERMTLDDAERHLIQRALARYEGNVSEAAQQLGLSRSALYRRLAHHGLKGQ